MRARNQLAYRIARLFKLISSSRLYGGAVSATAWPIVHPMLERSSRERLELVDVRANATYLAIDLKIRMLGRRRCSAGRPSSPAGGSNETRAKHAQSLNRPSGAAFVDPTCRYDRRTHGCSSGGRAMCETMIQSPASSTDRRRRTASRRLQIRNSPTRPGGQMSRDLLDASASLYRADMLVHSNHAAHTSCQEAEVVLALTYWSRLFILPVSMPVSGIKKYVGPCSSQKSG
jgi:hypothetical protein